MIVLLDNYDSFTYNLVQYLGDLGAEVQVYRNDKISAGEIFDMNPSGIVISPGPGTPDDAGIGLELISAALDKNLPLLGVCLGHQCIGQALGATIAQTEPLHGKTSSITHTDKGVFKGLDNPIEVTRYHSLHIVPDTLPDTLEITAKTENGIIMGVQHKTAPLHGVQFHPESIATQHGHAMLKNFLAVL